MSDITKSSRETIYRKVYSYESCCNRSL